MSDLRHTFLTTPLCELVIVADAIGLRRVTQIERMEPPEDSQRDDASLKGAHEQLRAYFAAELREFDLPLNPQGTPFQLQVWESLQEIPYAHTTSYGELARKLNKPNASRAVGAANGANPIPFIIPCHRVIGADGTLTGYAGGLELKKALLELEGVILESPKSSLFTETHHTSPTR